MRMSFLKRKLRVIIDSKELSSYGISFEDFLNLNPVPSKFFDEILKQATQTYGVRFDENIMKIIPHRESQEMELELHQISNIIKMRNEYTEECTFLEGMEYLFQLLPDEKIDLDMPEKDKKEIINKIRNGEGRDILRKMYM